MRIRCNGEPRELPSAATVADLLADVVPGDTRGTAVAVDGHVVPRGAWGRTELADGADVEVLRAVQGGA